MAVYEPIKHDHEAKVSTVDSQLRNVDVSTVASKRLEDIREALAEASRAEAEAFEIRVLNANLPPDEEWTRHRLSHICGLLVQQRPWRAAPLLSQSSLVSASNHDADAATYDADDEPASKLSLRHALVFAQTLKQLMADERFTSEVREGFSRAFALCQDAAFLPRDLVDLADALRRKLDVEREKHFIRRTVTTAMQVIDALQPDLRNCEYLLHKTIDDGEVAEAERVAEGQLRLYEHLLRLIMDQYDALDQHGRTDAEEEKRHRWAVFRSARHDVWAVAARVTRRMECLRDDAARVRCVLDEATSEDTAAANRYDDTIHRLQRDIASADAEVDAQLTRMEGLIAQIRDAESRIVTASRRRFETIAQRSVVLEAEARRSSSHESLLVEANAYLSEAKQQLDRLANAAEATKLMNVLILEGTNTIADRHRESRARASDIAFAIHKEHLRVLSEYALCASRHAHRKLGQWSVRNQTGLSAEMNLELATDVLNPMAKRHAMDRDASRLDARQLWIEVQSIKRELDSHIADFDQRCVPGLRARQYEFQHPADLAHDACLQRRETVADWRDAVDVTPGKLRQSLEGEARGIAEALRRLRAAESTRRLRYAHTAQIGSPSPYRTYHQGGDTGNLVASPPQRGRPGTAVIRRHEDRTVAEAMRKFDTMLTELPQLTAAEAPAQETNWVSAFATVSKAESMASRVLQRPATAPATRSGCTASGKVVVLPKTTSASQHSASPVAAGESSMPLKQAVDEPLDAAALLARNGPVASKLFAIAQHDFAATERDELSFVKGDSILVLGTCADEDGWYRGVLNHHVGVFPGNYVAFRRAPLVSADP